MSAAPAQAAPAGLAVPDPAPAHPDPAPLDRAAPEAPAVPVAPVVPAAHAGIAGASSRNGVHVCSAAGASRYKHSVARVVSASSMASMQAVRGSRIRRSALPQVQAASSGVTSSIAMTLPIVTSNRTMCC